jgi:hypothetical protein
MPCFLSDCLPDGKLSNVILYKEADLERAVRAVVY